MVPCKELDAAVIEAMLADESPMIDEVFIPGDDHADEIAKLQEQMSAAARAGNYKRVMELSAVAAELSALPSKPARWEPRFTDKTVASHFASLDLDGRREFLTQYEIFARRVTDECGKYVQFTMTHKSLLAAQQEAL
jgi:hypothetical protein